MMGSDSALDPRETVEGTKKTFYYVFAEYITCSKCECPYDCIVFVGAGGYVV